MSDPSVENAITENKWVSKINELGRKHDTRRVLAPVGRVGWTVCLALFVLLIAVLFLLLVVLLPLFMAIDRARGREAGAERVKELLREPWRRVGRLLGGN